LPIGDDIFGKAQEEFLGFVQELICVTSEFCLGKRAYFRIHAMPRGTARAGCGMIEVLFEIVNSASKDAPAATAKQSCRIARSLHRDFDPGFTGSRSHSNSA
jgi:hypothetical protein